MASAGLPSPAFPHGSAGSLLVQGPSGRGSALGARGLPQPGQTLSPGKGCCIQSPKACLGGEIWCQCLLEWLWGVTPAPFSPLSPEVHCTYVAQDTQL